MDKFEDVIASEFCFPDVVTPIHVRSDNDLILRYFMWNFRPSNQMTKEITKGQKKCGGGRENGKFKRVFKTSHVSFLITPSVITVQPNCKQTKQWDHMGAILYLHSGPTIGVDFSDLVPDLLREQARTPLFFVAQHTSLSQSTVGEQINLRQPGLPQN